jgi:hypothetical protein
VEAERDEWQRPHDVLPALDLGAGGIVADLGCGAIDHHYETPVAAETRLRQSGFEISRRDDRFIERANGRGGTWWLIVARKPVR